MFSDSTPTLTEKLNKLSMFDLLFLLAFLYLIKTPTIGKIVINITKVVLP